MELILLQDIDTVGRKGQVVRVRDGFARNYLFPQKLAIEVTKDNLKFVEEHKTRAAARHEKEKASAQTLAQKIADSKISIDARAGEQGKLFGSVTSEDIAKALQSKGFKIEKKQVVLKDSIRTVGSFPVVVEVFPEVRVTVTVEVVAQAS